MGGETSTPPHPRSQSFQKQNSAYRIFRYGKDIEVSTNLSIDIDEKGYPLGLWIPLIGDSVGEWLVPEDERVEPNKGSIILTDGKWGTCYQRSFNNGSWYRLGSEWPVSWQWIIESKRNVVLVYDAEERA